MKYDKKYRPEACVSTEARRTSLQYVNLDARGFLESCDGHMLIRIPCIIEDGDVPGTIPVNVFKQARTSCKGARIKEVSFVAGKDTITLVDGQTIPRVYPDVPYPETCRVLPREDRDVLRIALDADYLSSIASGICGDGPSTVTIEIPIDEDGKPIVEAYGILQNSNRDEKVKAILMPCKI